jgi:hypothetical protein
MLALGGHRVKATGVVLPFRPIEDVNQDQETEGAGGPTRSRWRLLMCLRIKGHVRP